MPAESRCASRNRSSVWTMIAECRQMRRRDGQQPPDADRGDAAAATRGDGDRTGFGAGAMGGTQHYPAQ